MTSTLAVPTESSIPYRQAAVCEDPRRPPRHHSQHRLPPGLRAEPLPVHPAHTTRLLSETPELSDGEVRR